MSEPPAVDRRAARRYRLALLAVTSLGIALRAVHLDGTIGFDEAASVRRFVQGGPPAIFGLYSGYGGATSNHLVNSLLAWLSARAFGPEVWALRLPAFLFGCAVVPLVGRLGARLMGSPRVGVVAAFLAATAPILVGYGPACRGYSTLLAFALVAALLVGRALEPRHASPARLVGIALALVLAGLSHMSGLVYLGAMGLTVTAVLVVRWRSSLAGDDAEGSRLASKGAALRVFVALAVATVVLVGWYSRGASILHDVGSRVTTGEFEDPSLAGIKSMVKSGSGDWLAMMAEHFLGSEGRVVALPIALFALGLAVGLRRTRVPGAAPSGAGLGLALGILLLTPLLLLAGRLQPVPRYFLFVQPFLLLWIALGIDGVARAVGRVVPSVRSGVVAALLALLTGSLGLPYLMRDLRGPGTAFMSVMREVDAAVEVVAEALGPDDVVIGFSSADSSLPFGIRGFWQVFGFHEQLRLVSTLSAPREDPVPRTGERRVWLVTPMPQGRFDPLLPDGARFEPLAETHGCRVARATLWVQDLRELPLGAFPSPDAARVRGTLEPVDPLAQGTAVEWRFDDPFGGAAYQLADDSPARHRGVIEAAWCGAVGELVSAPVPVLPGRLVEVETVAEARQRSGLRPFARVILRFLDADGTPVVERARMADLWPERQPASIPSTLRLATLAPEGAASVEVRLGLADGTAGGDRITFRLPRLWVEGSDGARR